MLINFNMTPEDKDEMQVSEMDFGLHLYTNRTYDNGTNGLFALGFEYGADGCSP